MNDCIATLAPAPTLQWLIALLSNLTGWENGRPNQKSIWEMVSWLTLTINKLSMTTATKIQHDHKERRWRFFSSISLSRSRKYSDLSFIVMLFVSLKYHYLPPQNDYSAHNWKVFKWSLFHLLFVGFWQLSRIRVVSFFSFCRAIINLFLEGKYRVASWNRRSRGKRKLRSVEYRTGMQTKHVL